MTRYPCVGSGAGGIVVGNGDPVTFKNVDFANLDDGDFVLHDNSWASTPCGPDAPLRRRARPTPIG